MAEVEFKVAGMSCGGCARNVTGVLQALPGVNSAQVSVDEAMARVSFDPALVSLEQLRQAVEAGGFDAPV